MEDAQIVIESYQRLKNLKLVGKETGIKWQTVYVILCKNNIPVIGDKERYGSVTDKLANSAEKMFQGLVPFAESLNEKKYQAKFDFLVNGLKVDVKVSNLNHGMKNTPGVRWAFCVKKQELLADFLVCFALKDGEVFKTLLIPGEVLRFYKHISIGENWTGKWTEYEVDKDELAEFFGQLKAA